ncbi:MAG TPA: C4-type zinc ribbon domain-containing protein [Herpetosiphonaceae bacterium]
MRVQLFTQIQQVDQQLTNLARERDAVLDEFRERDRLRDLRNTRRDLASKLKEERGHSSDLQWELDDVELRLRTLDEQERDGPSDPLVARELVILRERAAQLEEHVLAQLERIAELERQLSEVEHQVEQAAVAWNEREALLQTQLDRLGHDLEALQTQRQSIAGQLPDGALDLYDDLQRRHRGTALAPIRNRQCSACRARLPAAVFDLLSTPDPLVRCPRCGRVLYIEAEASE